MKWPQIPKQNRHYTYIRVSLKQGFHDRLMKVVACMVKGPHPTIALFFYVCVWEVLASTNCEWSTDTCITLEQVLDNIIMTCTGRVAQRRVPKII